MLLSSSIKMLSRIVKYNFFRHNPILFHSSCFWCLQQKIKRHYLLNVMKIRSSQQPTLKIWSFHIRIATMFWYTDLRWRIYLEFWVKLLTSYKKLIAQLVELHLRLFHNAKSSLRLEWCGVSSLSSKSCILSFNELVSS